MLILVRVFRFLIPSFVIIWLDCRSRNISLVNFLIPSSVITFLYDKSRYVSLVKFWIPLSVIILLSVKLRDVSLPLGDLRSLILTSSEYIRSTTESLALPESLVKSSIPASVICKLSVKLRDVSFVKFLIPSSVIVILQ